MNTDIIFTLGNQDDMISYQMLVDNVKNANSSYVRCCVNKASEQDHIKAIQIVKSLYLSETGKKLSVLLDVCIPKDKQRIMIKQNILLHEDDLVLLTNSSNEEEIDYPIIYTDSHLSSFLPGDEFILGDDILRIKTVQAINSNSLLCQVVIHEGMLTSNIGIASKKGCFRTTGSEIYSKCLSIIDNIRPEIVAISEIENISDIQKIKSEIYTDDYHPLIMSKIETYEAIKNAKEIIANSDLLMFARGCMAVNAGVENLFAAESSVINEAQQQHKKVYIASNIMKSLAKSNSPSRAEALDVAYLLNQKIAGLIITDSYGRTPSGANLINYVKLIENSIENSGVNSLKN